MGGPDADRSTSEATGAKPIPSDDALGREPRQVLVVGETVTGLALTLLLGHAGYDPLHVAGPERGAPSRAGLLWEPAREVLRTVVDDERIAEPSAPLDGLKVGRTGPHDDGPHEHSPAGDEGPVVVGIDRLRSALRAAVPDGRQVRDWGVASLDRRDGGVRVAFGHGSSERFDGVVDASGDGGLDGALGGPSPAARTLGQYEALVETDRPGERRLHDDWASDRLVQLLPRPTASVALLRITAAGAVDPNADARAVVGSTTPLAEVPDPDDRRAVTERRIRQVPSLGADDGRGRWGHDRVARCGGAARPVAPATGARLSLGVEDAVAFVTALVSETDRSRPVVAAYAAGRARRLERLLQTPAAKGLGRASGPDRELRAGALSALASPPAPGGPSDPNIFKKCS